jgi:selenoprotein W-related protein
LTSKLLSTYKQQITDLKLIPSGGGCFEITINGDLIYSKLKTGKFPEEKWVLEAVAAHTKKKK